MCLVQLAPVSPKCAKSDHLFYNTHINGDQLKTNETKTNAVNPVQIDATEVELVPKYKYQGSKISMKDTTSEDIRVRLATLGTNQHRMTTTRKHRRCRQKWDDLKRLNKIAIQKVPHGNWTRTPLAYPVSRVQPFYHLHIASPILFLNIFTLLILTQYFYRLFHSFSTLCDNAYFPMSDVQCSLANAALCSLGGLTMARPAKAVGTQEETAIVDACVC